MYSVSSEEIKIINSMNSIKTEGDVINYLKGNDIICIKSSGYEGIYIPRDSIGTISLPTMVKDL